MAEVSKFIQLILTLMLVHRIISFILFDVLNVWRILFWWLINNPAGKQVYIMILMKQNNVETI
ncbi:MAG: hypothetical protein ACTS42_02060 [Candidatus Hodgkinia cicadicola]